MYSKNVLLDPRHQRVAATTVVLLAVVVLTSMVTSPPYQYPSPTLRSSTAQSYTEIVSPKLGYIGYSASIGSSQKKKFTAEDYGKCKVTPAHAPSHTVTPTFTASYPGSGAKMTWNLIEALTGLVTGDDFQLNGHQNLVSIKTHYPSHEGREIPGADNVPRAILLVRHPLYSIPSYYNYLYEMEKKLKNHSTRAPLEAWIRWRNDSFDRQLQVWRRHTEYWMDHYSKVNRLVVAYENLTDDEMGPIEATRIAEFLSRSDGVTICEAEEIPCVWHTVVKYKKKEGRRLQEQQQIANAEANTENIPAVVTADETAVSTNIPPANNDNNNAGISVPESATEVKNGDAPPGENIRKAKPKLSDPAAPQSKRSGPKYIAPYTENQFKDLMQVLTMLLERYRDEKALAPILVKYIDEVDRRLVEPPFNPKDLNPK